MLHPVRIDLGNGAQAYELDDPEYDLLRRLTTGFGNRAKNDVVSRNAFGFVPGTHATHGAPDDVGEE